MASYSDSYPGSRVVVTKAVTQCIVRPGRLGCIGPDLTS